MNKKIFLVITTILLFIFLSLSGIALYQKFIIKLDIKIKNKNNIDNKKTITLTDSNNNIIGAYVCKYKNCDYAKYTTDDENYEFEYPITTPNIYKNVINNRYAFLYDYPNKEGKAIILYDILEKKEITTFKNFKNYYTDLENNKFIVQNQDNLWGIISLIDDYKILCDLKFNYISVKDTLDSESNNLIADRFVAKKDNKWMIIDENGNSISKTFDSMITSYNGLYISIINGSKYLVYDYEGNLMDNYEYDYINFISKYGIFVNNNILTIKDIEKNIKISEDIPLIINNYKNNNSFEINIENEQLIIKIKKDNLIIEKTYTYNLKQE